MTEAVFETKLSTEERALQALAVLSYTGTRLARDPERKPDGTGSNRTERNVMPEKTRIRIRRAIKRKMLARRIVIAAFVVVLLLILAYAAVWAYSRPYDVSLVFSGGAEPQKLNNPPDKAIIIATKRWLEKHDPTEPLPETDAALHYLHGGSGYAVFDRGTGELLYSITPYGKNSVYVRLGDRLTIYENVPSRIMRAIDRIRRRIDPVYAEEVPADYYNGNRVKRDSVKENDIYPRSPYSVFRP